MPTDALEPVSELFRRLRLPRSAGYELLTAGRLPIPIERVRGRYFVRRCDLDTVPAATP